MKSVRIAILCMVVFAGCVATLPTEPTISADLAVEIARAVIQGRSAPPDDAPTPKPGGRCQPCNGTGKLPTDGRVVVQCGACGGTGKVR